MKSIGRPAKVVGIDRSEDRLSDWPDQSPESNLRSSANASMPYIPCSSLFLHDDDDNFVDLPKSKSYSSVLIQLFDNVVCLKSFPIGCY
jgi:hypothetical protein